MWHFLSPVDDRMFTAQGHAQSFCHTDGCLIRGSDATYDACQFQPVEGIVQADTGCFQCIALMPIRVVKDISEFHLLVSVDGAFHQTGLSDYRPVLFEAEGIVSETVPMVSDELPVYPFTEFSLYKAVLLGIHHFRLFHDRKQCVHILAG